MKNKNLILDPKAVQVGCKYREDKPWSCKYCFWWGGRVKGCGLKQCHYLIPMEEKVIPNEKKAGDCSVCPYGKHRPCIGYCIAKLHREMIRKEGEDNDCRMK